MGDGRLFHVGACLGRGGFGEVYRARMIGPTGFEVDVALKVLRRDLDPTSQAVQRLRDEGRLLARLSHPAILRAFDLAVVEERVALVTEYVEGQDLGEVAEPLSPRTALEVIARVAGALDAAWSAPLGDGGPLRLVHRDIKPSNIRLSRHGDVKVLDFGIARTDSVEREARTATDMMVGSPPYMAPERFLEQGVRLASDVYALGSSLFEALTGERFFADQTVTMLAGLAVQRARHDAFREARLAGMPSELGDLIRACMAYDPDERPTPAELEARCEAQADHAAGLSLARWARERVWPPPPILSGELADRTLREGAKFASASPAVVALPEPLAPATSVDRRRPGWWLWAGWAAVGAGGVGLASLAVLVLAVGSIGYALRPAAPEATAPVPPPAAVAAPAPTPEPPPAPAPVLALPRAVKPASAPRPSPVAPPLPPEPSPDPTPEPVAVAHSSVSVRGAAALSLHGPGANWSVPGQVPAGTYAVFARWRAEDADFVELNGAIVVPVGGSPLGLVCSSRFSRCNSE